MKISDRIHARTAYVQLAEECAELSQAALKMVRYFDPDGALASNATLEYLLDDLTEEIADVMVCISVVMDYLPKDTSDIVMMRQVKKTERWLARIERKG